MGWFHALTDRERALVLLGAVLGIAAVLYLMVLEPAHLRRVTAQAALEQAQADADWLNEKRAEIAVLKAKLDQGPSRRKPPPESVAALESAIKSAPILDSLARIAPRDARRVELVFEDASYTGLLSWMDAHGIGDAVESLQIRATGTTDRVDATLIVDLTPPSEVRP